MDHSQTHTNSPNDHHHHDHHHHHDTTRQTSSSHTTSITVLSSSLVSYLSQLETVPRYPPSRRTTPFCLNKTNLRFFFFSFFSFLSQLFLRLWDIIWIFVILFSQHPFSISSFICKTFIMFLFLAFFFFSI